MTIETVVESKYEVEAETEVQAFDAALEGSGNLIQEDVFYPTLIYSEELEGAEEDDNGSSERISVTFPAVSNED